jgi:hypothetical protein
MHYCWREDKRQKTWLWVGLLFLFFYFAEAVLFWGPEPRVAAPPFTPLVYWGLFGAILIWIVTHARANELSASGLERGQGVVLGIGITAAVVGLAFLIIRRTGDLTLGHAVLLFTLAQAGIIIGAMSFNVGWFLAGLCWIGSGFVVLWQPAVQDYTIGTGVALGFVVIGSFRQCVVSAAAGD